MGVLWMDSVMNLEIYDFGGFFAGACSKKYWLGMHASRLFMGDRRLR
jgi:hypothetical protein